MRRPLLPLLPLVAVLATTPPGGASSPPFATEASVALVETTDRLGELLLELDGETFLLVTAPAPDSLATRTALAIAGAERLLRTLEEEAAVPVEPVELASPEGAIERLRTLRRRLREDLERETAESLERPVDAFGRRWSRRALWLEIALRLRGDLGHLVAHAEHLGVVPPWVRIRRESDASDD